MVGTRDGGALLTGYTDSQDVMDIHVIKTDADGNEVWTKTLGNKPFYDFGNAVLELADGGIFYSSLSQPTVLTIAATETFGFLTESYL